ncbi:MAG: RNA polymerase sigma factor [Cyclobacteriaceae bacterium]
MRKSFTNQPEDEVIWISVQRGNQAAFETLYSRFFKPLYNYGRKVCSNKDIVEDAIHDLFLDIWRYRENLSPTTSVRFYLYRALRRRIVKNETKDIESSVFNFQLDDFLLNKSFSHEEELIAIERNVERNTKLKRHLNNLSPRQYESLILRFYDELSYEEIGLMLEVNEQSARNLVQRGLEQLRHFANMITVLFFLWVIPG